MKVAIIGEAMLEFHAQGGTRTGLQYAGDTLNTAIHMSRSGCDVAYVTALGSDKLSEALVEAWQDEGLDTRFVLQHPERNPGIYAIHVDPSGERSFTYWRERSAARAMFELPGIDDVCGAIAAVDLLYFSHISLGILPPEGRERLLQVARQVRANGGLVAYDSNFRSRIWESADAARSWSNQAVAVATIGLPTADDERTLHGTTETDAEVASRWLELGCTAVVAKSGAEGCLIALPGMAPEALPCERIEMVDSSGAGDAFNAGYLTAMLAGEDPKAAAHHGHDLAAWVIMRRGALPSPDQLAPYR